MAPLAGASALLWIVVIGARVLFSYGANHWSENQLGSWPTMHSIPSVAKSSPDFTRA